jgi:hypothetical protein
MHVMFYGFVVNDITSLGWLKGASFFRENEHPVCSKGNHQRTGCFSNVATH